MSAKPKQKATEAKTVKKEEPVKKAVKAEKVEAKKEEAKKEEVAEQTILVIRIRGSPGMRRTIMNTLQLMNLHKVNHATILRTNASTIGMLHKAKDYIAWGTISAESIGKLLKKRGLLTGNKPITDGHVQFATNFDSIDNLANGIFEGKIRLREVKDLKPIFRLHPPIGGYHKSIKQAVNAGGILGNQGENINNILKKML
jgi:large subunit ribosomal protein L30